MFKSGVVSIVLLGTLFTTGAAVDFTCTEAYCQVYIEKTGCPTLPVNCTQEHFDEYPDSGILLPSPSLCNCCQFCIMYLVLGDDCVVGKAGQPVPTSICGPGLMCLKVNPTDEIAKCVRLDSPCMQAQLEWEERRENGTLGSAEVRPECDERGQYRPAHCIPGATCYCVNPVDGSRMFGESPFVSTSTPLDMHCPCSTSLWRASQGFSGKKGGTRCLPDGRFDQLQCVDNKCFCVDTEDTTMQGREFVHVAEISAESLPCFDPEIHAENTYLKPCEDEKLKVRQTLELLTLEGIFGLGLKEPSCDEDGHYSKLQEPGSVKRCVDPENNKIEEFEVSAAAPEAQQMDCNCARTHWLMATTADDSHVTDLPSCCGNGNYAVWQCRRGSCYCVDRDGNQVGNESRDVAQLPCHDERGACALYGVYDS